MEVHPGMDTPLHVNKGCSYFTYPSAAVAFVGAVSTGEGLTGGNVETAVF
jgi:hypothetical protein